MAEYIDREQIKYHRERVLNRWSGSRHTDCDVTYKNIVTKQDIDSIHTANVIEIPKGATNGDMIKAMFPNELLTSITSTLWWGDNMSFNKDWWNAPYKAESEDK